MLYRIAQGEEIAARPLQPVPQRNQFLPMCELRIAQFVIGGSQLDRIEGHFGHSALLAGDGAEHWTPPRWTDGLAIPVPAATGKGGPP